MSGWERVGKILVGLAACVVAFVQLYALATIMPIVPDTHMFLGDWLIIQSILLFVGLLIAGIFIIAFAI